MKKSITRTYMYILGVAAAVFAAFWCIQDISTVKAGVAIGWDSSVTVGKTKFQKKSMKGSGYKAVITKDGVKKTLRNVGHVCVKDENTLYYTRGEGPVGDYSFMYSIYSYNVNTEKSTKITSEKDYLMLGCSGDYIYGGTDTNDCGNVEFFVLNAKTKKKKNLNICIAEIQIENGRVLAITGQGALGDLPVYTFKTDGSDLVKIAEAEQAVIKHGTIYYTTCSKKRLELVKVYKCNLRGRKKKAVSGWITRGEAVDKYLY